MENTFSGSEIVELGIQIEINGKDFYNALFIRTKNKNAKKIYNFLEDEETQHIKDFEKILDSIKHYEPKEAYPDEYFAYMNNLADTILFTKKDKGKEAVKFTKSDKEAVSLGKGFEEDSIKFYDGMKKIVPEEDHALLNELISQEKNHLNKLVNLEKSL